MTTYSPGRENSRQKLQLGLRNSCANSLDVDAASFALTALSDTVKTRLGDADWSLKRELMKLLIERIEIHRDEVRLVYKVPPNPFVLSPDNRGLVQHWLSRHIIAPQLRNSDSKSTMQLAWPLEVLDVNQPSFVD